MSKKYHFSAPITISANISVEADSIEEAVKKASEAGVMSLTSSFNYERNNFRGEKPASELWYISDVDGEIDINSMDSSEEIDISEIIKNL